MQWFLNLKPDTFTTNNDIDIDNQCTCTTTDLDYYKIENSVKNIGKWKKQFTWI